MEKLNQQIATLGQWSDYWYGEAVDSDGFGYTELAQIHLSIHEKIIKLKRGLEMEKSKIKEIE